eukprot:scaffold40342_cov61-Attheya_sp.AAC.1
MSNAASSLIYGGQPDHFALCSCFFCQEDVVYEKEKGANSSSSSSIISRRSWMSADKVTDFLKVWGTFSRPYLDPSLGEKLLGQGSCIYSLPAAQIQ